ncbi:hypothetical protein V6N11_053436 [Hibiscus sabdariffa]|uniref:Uncharacterized protein n=1 Tax=Hibiscus sabdariffa TaxID=183260 RepID=A0ABR2UD90_9ROSI
MVDIFGRHEASTFPAIANILWPGVPTAEEEAPLALAIFEYYFRRGKPGGATLCFPMCTLKLKILDHIPMPFAYIQRPTPVPPKRKM